MYFLVYFVKNPCNTVIFPLGINQPIKVSYGIFTLFLLIDTLKISFFISPALCVTTLEMMVDEKPSAT